MENLKKLRLERKLSQQKLAENFGITQQAIYNYENGITEPDIYMLKQMAAFFHTTVDYLVGYDACDFGGYYLLDKEINIEIQQKKSVSADWQINIIYISLCYFWECIFDKIVQGFLCTNAKPYVTMMIRINGER